MTSDDWKYLNDAIMAWAEKRKAKDNPLASANDSTVHREVRRPGALDHDSFALLRTKLIEWYVRWTGDRNNAEDVLHIAMCDVAQGYSRRKERIDFVFSLLQKVMLRKKADQHRRNPPLRIFDVDTDIVDKASASPDERMAAHDEGQWLKRFALSLGLLHCEVFIAERWDRLAMKDIPVKVELMLGNSLPLSSAYKYRQQNEMELETRFHQRE
jgi:DNA-directed RNA polymerase specialized sigma24 family protein